MASACLRVAAPSIRFVPWAALASCWPLSQQLLPVSAAGGGRSCCVAGWVESRGREGGVGTPLPASGPAERLCALKASRNFSRGARTFPLFFCHQKRTSPGYHLLPHLYVQKVVFCRISTQSLTKAVIFCILSLSVLAQFSCCVSGC